MADQSSLKENLKDQISHLVEKRVDLMETLERLTTKLRTLIERKDLRDKYMDLDEKFHLLG